MLRRAKKTFTGQLDLVKFVERQRMMLHTVLVTLPMTQFRKIDQMSTLIIHDSSNLDDDDDIAKRYDHTQLKYAPSDLIDKRIKSI